MEIIKMMHLEMYFFLTQKEVIPTASGLEFKKIFKY